MGRMIVVRRSIEVAAPVAEVFHFVSCTENYPRYIPAYEAGAVLAGEDGQPGMTFRWHSRTMGLRLAAVETIVERQERERIRYRGGMMGIPFESCMETTPAGDATHFTVTVSYEPPWPLAAPGLEWATRQLVEREVASSLTRLRSLFGGTTAMQLDSVRDVYALWGRHPLLYAAQDWITFVGRHRIVRRRAVAALGLGPGARVLEVACGTGRNFELIEEVIGPTGSLVAFDYSREMLAAAWDLARRRGWRNIEYVEGDAATLAVGGEPFDGVLCVLGMSAIPDHRRALERCREVLRPGGALVVCDARPFSGRLAVLNPLVRAVYRRGAAWRPERDLVGDLRRICGDVVLEEFNLGTFFVAKAVRRSAARPA